MRSGYQYYYHEILTWQQPESRSWSLPNRYEYKDQMWLTRAYNCYRCRKRKLSPMALGAFVHYNDLQLYGLRASTSGLNDDSDSPPATPFSSRSALLPLLSHAHLSILNSFPSMSTYHDFLATLDLASPTRLRPTWDAYFMTLASLAAHRSNCMKRRVGCVLVHNARIISTGYNGTPRGLVNCNEGGCPALQRRLLRGQLAINVSLPARGGKCTVGSWTRKDQGRCCLVL